jgi:thioredoxin 1
MNGKLTKIIDSEFDSLVILPRKPIVVIFTAEWSGPSKMAKPILESATEKYADRATFYELNIDDNPEMAQKYGVSNVPTVLVFAYGQPISRRVGKISRDQINELVERIINSGEMYKTAMAFGRKLSSRFGGRFRV